MEHPGKQEQTKNAWLANLMHISLFPFRSFFFFVHFCTRLIFVCFVGDAAAAAVDRRPRATNSCYVSPLSLASVALYSKTYKYSCVAMHELVQLCVQPQLDDGATDDDDERRKKHGERR